MYENTIRKPTLSKINVTNSNRKLKFYDKASWNNSK